MRRLPATDPRRLRAAWWTSIGAAAGAGALAHAAWVGMLAAVPAWIGAALLATLAAALGEAGLRRQPTRKPDPSTLPMDIAEAGPEPVEAPDDRPVEGLAAPVGIATHATAVDEVDPGTDAPFASDRHQVAPDPALAWVVPGDDGTAGPGDASSPASGHATTAADQAPDPAVDRVPDEVADALRAAIDAHELAVVYEPVFELATRQVQAVDMLLRAPRALQARLPAQDLADVAERLGLGPRLGEWLIGSACRQMARWRQLLGDAAPRQVSVGLTPARCLDPALHARLEEAARAHDLPPRALQIALPTAALVADDALQRAMQRLREAGVAVTLKGFGTGSSSLAGLRQLPIDLVQVDPGIVRRAEEGSAARLVLESTLRVAASLGLPLVASGVQTPAQLEMLRTLGCTLAQGPLLCGPIDASALTRRIRSGECMPRSLGSACRSASPLNA